MTSWAEDAVFYHLYPLGALGAEKRNDFRSPPAGRLSSLLDWADHIADLGATALYLGPVFESTAHGYDTRDYFSVDRRLGTEEDLARLVGHFHGRGIKVLFDAVFNHVGRDHPAFLSLREKGRASAYRSWFAGLDFSVPGPFGEPFRYEGWNGCYDLVKLDLGNREVRDHLFSALTSWIDRYDIDGLRLDAADCLEPGFIAALKEVAEKKKPGFWLLGEMVFGDYRSRTGLAMLDSITNYECYKGLWSSLNDRNFFEIAYSLNRQFGPAGIYRDLPLYAFADNHDVSRAASVLNKRAHLYPLYGLLFTMPGIPSLYYGSEFGLPGKKTAGADDALRPAVSLRGLKAAPPEPDLFPALKRLARLRREQPALRRGGYEQVLVRHEQFVFSRSLGMKSLLVAVNSGDRPVEVEVSLPRGRPGVLRDILNGGDALLSRSRRVRLELFPCWVRVFEVAEDAEEREF